MVEIWMALQAPAEVVIHANYTIHLVVTI
jgi:hypothetical protein